MDNRTFISKEEWTIIKHKLSWALENIDKYVERSGVVGVQVAFDELYACMADTERFKNLDTPRDLVNKMDFIDSTLPIEWKHRYAVREMAWTLRRLGYGKAISMFDDMCGG